MERAIGNCGRNGSGRFRTYWTIKATFSPLEAAITDYRLVPVKVIEPVRNLYDTLEFNHALIEAAIDAGRIHVNDNWTDLQQFPGV